MRRRVLVLGCNGMLGHRVLAELRRRHTTTGTVRGYDATEGVIDHVDAKDFSTVERALSAANPDVIVNCMGVVKQRPSAIEDLIAVNALLPHRLARAAEQRGAWLLHFSTDCVFSGSRGSYTEHDTPDPSDTYGMSKVLGEPQSENALTIRTSFVGRELHHRTGLLEWFLAQKRCRGFTQHYFSGVSTTYVARFVGALVDEQRELSGTYHLAGPRVSKYELLCAVRDTLQLDTEVIPDATSSCDRSLDGARLDLALGRSAPTLRDVVVEATQ